MSKRKQFDREQLKRLNQEGLIGLILVLRQQLAPLQALIQQPSTSSSAVPNSDKKPAGNFAKHYGDWRIQPGRFLGMD